MSHSFSFLTMSVTYQVNCHVRLFDNVCDTLGQPYPPFFWQCVWYIRTTISSNFLTMHVTNQANCVTVSSHFPTMSVTYQVNYLVKFSDNVCDISGWLYHCIIQFSDNVCDISGQILCQRLRRRGKEGKKKKESNWGTGGHYIVASQPPNGNQLQCRHSCQFSDNVCDISQELCQFIIPFSKQCLWHLQIILFSCDAWCLPKHFLTAHVTYQLSIRDQFYINQW